MSWPTFQFDRNVMLTLLKERKKLTMLKVTLRAEVARLKSMTAVTMGVGNGGDENLFVHGDYDSIKAAQALVFRAEEQEERKQRDKVLLRNVLEALEMRCGTNADERKDLIPALSESHLISMLLDVSVLPLTDK